MSTWVSCPPCVEAVEDSIRAAVDLPACERLLASPLGRLVGRPRGGDRRDREQDRGDQVDAIRAPFGIGHRSGEHVHGSRDDEAEHASARSATARPS